ncbi:MAG TPA: histidinol-phosphate transaminase [Fimbriimonadaceae bacterium]|nr:histidinol-phosphate transaminase [Fimbriimonadaceae bacterium]
MNFPLRPNVRRMTPYSPGKPIAELQRERDVHPIVKLASNENPLGPSPRALEAIAAAAQHLHLYPDASGYALRQALSAKYGLPPEQLVLGNGSDEIIHLLGQVLLGAETDEVIVGEPSFVRYDAAAHLANCRLVEVPLDADLRHDLPAMAQAVTEHTRLVFIANPNNPTGTIVDRVELDRFLDDLPPHVLVVLDEAYYEFASADPAYPDSIALVRAGRPVFGLRTFSKAYGLAGIRVGWGFGPAEVTDAIERAREPFNVNSLAQAAAIAALEDDAHLARTLDVNRRGMERLTAAFRASGVKWTESHANFVCVDLGRPARPIFEALLAHGVIVRPGDVLGLPNHLRISIGADHEVDQFIGAWETVVPGGVPA